MILTEEMLLGAFLAIGGVTVGLVKYIFNSEKKILLSKIEHEKICPERFKDFKKDFFEMFDDRIENKILKEVRKMNGQGKNK